MSVVKEIKVKINKAQIIRDGFANLGMEATTKEIQAYYKEQTGEEIDRQYVYIQKAGMNKELPLNKGKDGIEQDSHPIARKPKKSAKKAPNSADFVSIIKDIRNLISFFGDKKRFVEVIESL